MHLEASALNQTTIIGNRSKRLNGHSIPHQLRIIGGHCSLAIQSVKASLPSCLRTRHASERALFGSGTWQNDSWLTTAFIVASSSGTLITLPSMTRAFS